MTANTDDDNIEVITGTEAAAGAMLDPFGDAMHGPQADEFSQADEPRAAEPRAVLRQDGLMLELEDSPVRDRMPKQRPARTLAFETAADLAARMAGGGPASRTYEIGQRVRHAEYGDGVISGISGMGSRAVGTVIFTGPAGTRKFILGHGALEAVE